MAIAVIIVLVALVVTMIAVTIYAVYSAKDGFEDEHGFHSLEKEQPDSRSMTRDEPPSHAEMTAFGGRSVHWFLDARNPARGDATMAGADPFVDQTATDGGVWDAVRAWPTSSGVVFGSPAGITVCRWSCWDCSSSLSWWDKR